LFEHEIDGTGQLDGQHGVGLELIAQACFEALGEGPEEGIAFAAPNNSSGK
jgi:LDH2 family malate/lactate/ureidoglycolate dehydrogenase